MTKKLGRPSAYTPEFDDAICEHIAMGNSLASWCAKPGNPSYSMVCRWLQGNEDFRERYMRAREAQADLLAEQILEIANTPCEGVKTEYDAKGKVVKRTKGDMIEHRRLQVDARKWYAAKLRPKVYSERVHNEHSGEVTFKGLAERMRRQRGEA